MDDLHDLLAGRDRANHLLADSLLGDLVDKAAGDRKRDIGLQQRHAHFAHRLADIGFRERTTPTQAVEHAAKPVAQALKHRPTPKRFYAGGRKLAGRRASVDAVQSRSEEHTSELQSLMRTSYA